jgi:hypothetical protein
MLRSQKVFILWTPVSIFATVGFLTNETNKLEYLLQTGFSSLAWCEYVRLKPISVKHFSDANKGRLLCLPTNIRLVRKRLLGTNTQAYWSQI